MPGMRASFTPEPLGFTIAAVARRQYGVVTRGQLAALGLSRSGIGRQVAAGRLHRLHTGVYAVGHRVPLREARWLAAVLACGEGALLSWRSAAWLWRMRSAEGPRPDVSVPTRNGRRRPGIAIHRCRLEPQDRGVRQGIPVTSPARTLVDLAGVLERAELVRALRETQFLRLFDLGAVREVLDRRPSRVIGALVDDLVLTQSPLEDRLLTICDRHRLPRPLTQEVILGRRMDFVWPAERVVVETDGWEGHSTRSAFQADRSASNALQLAGWTILRFTHADLRRRPLFVARQIRFALTRSGREMPG